jgi:uncharacterized protein
VVTDAGFRVLVGGHAVGELMRLTEPLSLWGGLDPESGRIVDQNHPQLGQRITGTIVAMPHGRGSSSSSSVLAEALRLGTGPAGFVLETPDSILVIGSLVANRLYGTDCPIVCARLPEGSTGAWTIDQNQVAPLPERGSGAQTP